MVEKTTKPLLIEGLTVAERAMLGVVTVMPGFQILIKLLEAGCEEATRDVIKLDPEIEDYERILQVRQQNSRSINKFSQLLLNSIRYHTQMAVEAEENEELEAKIRVLQSEKD